MDEQKLVKMDALARDILTLSRNTLLVNLRFLDAALSRFEYVHCDGLALSTDGDILFYNPLYVLRHYKQEKESMVRDYLHIIMHCIFQHMYIHAPVNLTAWDLACDIAAEYTITELGLGSAAARREAHQQKILERLKKEIGQLTAEKIYRYFLDEAIASTDLADLRGLFYADDHRVWYMSEDKKKAMGIGGKSGRPSAVSEADWKTIAEWVQTDLETFGKQRGDKVGRLLQNLREVTREKYDYTEFLKKFAVLGEIMKVSDDEFDYIFYTYGLRLYEKMPLVEPLEYKEVKRIREFAIAIDTSGSVAGELVQAFVQKTYNILKSTESFFSKINLHIIQCDADIQEDVKITSQDDFDEYLKTMKIRGLGGTDFRPVFDYVDKLRKEKEFVNLKGLVYFTDGCGTFPARKPDYDTAFVFVDDDYNNLDVPPWAIKLVLRRDEI